MGVDKTGITDCVQLGRREELKGLGFSTKANKVQDDSWWQNVYNKSINAVKTISKKTKTKTSNGAVVKSRGTLDHSEIAEGVKKRRESMHTQILTDEEYNDEDEEMFGEFVKLVKGAQKKTKSRK